MFDLLTPMVPLPVTLCNEVVTLEPIEPRHATDLQAALDDRVFEYMPMRSSVKTPSEVRRYVDFQQRRTETIAFAVIDNSSGAAIGSTWITESARGTRVNPAMKHLMLSHAFDGLGAVRVELKTDARNLRSRSAILKLGAQFEGILRQHLIMPDGHLRDTAMYSITRDDWVGVERGLLARLGA